MTVETICGLLLLRRCAKVRGVIRSSNDRALAPEALTLARKANSEGLGRSPPTLCLAQPSTKSAPLLPQPPAGATTGVECLRKPRCPYRGGQHDHRDGELLGPRRVLRAGLHRPQYRDGKHHQDVRDEGEREPERALRCASLPFGFAGDPEEEAGKQEPKRRSVT